MIHRHTVSFKHAIDGIIWALKTQPNYRIHLFLSILSITAGFILPISYAEFLIIITLIFMGLALETVNTSIEKVCDAVDRSYNLNIKIAKDVAAGAMLLFAIGAFIIACAIFVPKLITILL